jgi:hypothetical protein
MQGRKTFSPKMLYSISLQELVPENNFYRRLLTALDLHWLYKETQIITEQKVRKVLTLLSSSRYAW